MKFFKAACRALGMLAICIGPLAAHAGPMGFKDSWMSMGDFGPNWREAFVNYAYTPRDALGIDATYMRSDDGTRTRDLAEVTYTRLLRRWNSPNVQVNLWFAGGFGAVTLRGQVSGTADVKAMASPGILFDLETTRFYLGATARLYRAKGIDHDYRSFRTGFSFYEAEYDETQPWLIVEARRMHDLSDKTELTPMLRLINKNYFIEAGVNNSRQARFNFMYIF